MEQFVRKRIIGIAFGEQEISVCAHFQDQIVEVLRLPAVFTVSPVGEETAQYGTQRSAAVRSRCLHRIRSCGLFTGT